MLHTLNNVKLATLGTRLLSLLFLLNFAVHGAEFVIVPRGPVGPCDIAQWTKDWPGCTWGDGIKEGRLSCVERMGRKCFAVHYAVGGIGTENGGVGWRMPIGNWREAKLSYIVRFSEGFDWVKGGKLPGLCGGPDNVSGGRPANGTNGFSVRLMWRANGKGEAYVYHKNQKSNYGDSFAFPEDFRFSQNASIRVIIRVGMNDPGLKNGRLDVWIADNENAVACQILQRSELEWRDVSSFGIDSLLFETFHGGGDPSWAPTRHCFTEFSEINIATKGFESR